MYPPPPALSIPKSLPISLSFSLVNTYTLTHFPVMENAIFKGDNNPNAIPVWGVFAIFAALVVPPMTLFILFAHRIEKRPSRHRTATLLVLGDIGRSPRMMYHAESLAKAGWDTYVIGYGGGLMALSGGLTQQTPPLSPRYSRRPSSTCSTWLTHQSRSLPCLGSCEPLSVSSTRSSRSFTSPSSRSPATLRSFWSR